MQEVRRRLRKFRDIRIMVRNLPSFNIGSGNFDIDYVIRGPELEQLSFYAKHLRSRAHELGIVDADTTLKLNKPELRVQIDRARAADWGVDTDDIARALHLMVGGEENVSRFRAPR
jgi:HAE1 family hydrophobic/amphiphilic exporter-1